MNLTQSIFLSLAVLTFSKTASAQFIEPVDICESLRSPAEQIECSKLVESTQYFDSGAINLCYEFAFSSDKLACLRAISNKLYEDGTLRTCKMMELGSRKLQCLVQNGRNYQTELPATQCVKIATLEGELRKSILLVNQSENDKANVVLTSLLRKVQTCNSAKGAIY